MPATSVRLQIKAAAVAALSGNTEAGTRVLDTEPHALDDADMPAVRVELGDEEIERSSMGAAAQAKLLRTCELSLRLLARGNSGADDQLERIIAEVETALFADAALLALLKSLDLVSIETGVAGQTNKRVAYADVVFVLVYRTVEGTPGTAIS